MADFSDIPGALWDAKMSQLGDRYNNVTSMFSDPNAWARQRFGLPAENTEGNVKPVTQTITTDPESGEQMMTVKGRPQDLSSQNPLTPTVTPAATPSPVNLANSAELMNGQPNTAMAPVAGPVAPPPGMMPTGAVPGMSRPVADMSNVQPGQQIPPNQIPQPIMDESGRTIGYETPAQTMARTQARAPYAAPVQPVAPTMAPAPAMAPPMAQPMAAPVNPAQVMPVASTPPAPAPVAATPPAPVAATPPAPAPAAAPAAAPAPAPAPALAAPVPSWQADIERIQRDATKLAAYVGNEANPEHARKIAGNLWRKTEDLKAKGLEVEKLFINAGNGDVKAVNTIAKDLKTKSEEGSLIKAYLFARLGLNKLADEEQGKIMGGGVASVQMKGENFTVEKNSRGEIVRAWNQDGQALNKDKIANLSANAVRTGTNVYGFAGGISNIPSTGEPVHSRQNNRTGDAEYVYMTGPNKGTVYTGTEIPVQQRVTSQALIGANQLITDLQKVYGTKVFEAEAEFIKNNGAFGSETNTYTREQFRREYGLASGMPNAQEILPRVAPAAPAAPAPAPAAPVVPGPATVKPIGFTPGQEPGGMMTAGYTPGQEPGGFIKTGGPTYTTEQLLKMPENKRKQVREQEAARDKAALEVGTYGTKSGIDINKKKTEELNTANRVYGDVLAKDRQTATSQRSTIDRLQTAIDKNPTFWGIDTNSTAWRAYVDVNSTNENKAAALNTLARNLNIPENKRSEFDQTMNDYRNLQVNAITGSGLTSSQTNTENESQRVIGTIGNISDRPAAAKATLEYAKAKIEYADAKARAWITARKANPNIDRAAFDIDFDDTKGEKIFKDANERMNKILGASATPNASGLKDGQTSVSKSGKPMVVRNGKWEYQ